uniref:Uncharacterized protein n=1 Tax=Romanomermis culicivorax TaxID=13658 RepID=A0A915JWN7_ROMCU
MLKTAKNGLTSPSKLRVPAAAVSVAPYPSTIMQPIAARMSRRTSGLIGALPEIMSRTRPPIASCKFRKTFLSANESRRTIKLEKIKFQCKGWAGYPDPDA